MGSDDGNLVNAGITKTYGDMLARDIKIVFDEVGGIIFLDGWVASRGARLEAFVGILCGHEFARYVGFGNIEGMSPQTVLTQIMRQTSWEINSVQR